MQSEFRNKGTIRFLFMSEKITEMKYDCKTISSEPFLTTEYPINQVNEIFSTPEWDIDNAAAHD